MGLGWGPFVFVFTRHKRCLMQIRNKLMNTSYSCFKYRGLIHAAFALFSCAALGQSPEV